RSDRGVIHPGPAALVVLLGEHRDGARFATARPPMHDVGILRSALLSTEQGADKCQSNGQRSEHLLLPPQFLVTRDGGFSLCFALMRLRVDAPIRPTPRPPECHRRSSQPPSWSGNWYWRTGRPERLTRPPRAVRARHAHDPDGPSPPSDRRPRPSD